MRLTTSVIAGFIAFGAATPAGLAVKPTSTRDSVHTASAQPTPADSNWHIGCDANNLCSYFQKGAASATRAVGVVNALSDTSCQLCTVSSPCSKCPSRKFECNECDHYQCYNEFTSSLQCINVPPALGDLVRNTTVTVTTAGTITSTTIETSFTIATMGAVEDSTLTITSTSADALVTTTVTHTPTPKLLTTTITPAPTDAVFTTTITLSRPAVPSRHTGLAPRDEVASNDGEVQPPLRRNAAFKQSECMPCDEQTCPHCHADCAGCEKFLCENLATHMTVCMSVRSKWQPPSFNISASAPSETTTVVVMPQPGITTTTQTVVISTVVATVPTPSSVVTVTVSAPAASTTTVVVVPEESPCTTTIASVPRLPDSTVTVYPPRPQTSTKTVIAQRPQLSTKTVFAQRPQVSTKTVFAQRPQISTVTVIPQRPQTSTVIVEAPHIQPSTVTVQKPASTVVYQQPGTTSVVTVQNPASTVVYQQPGTTETVTHHYQDAASTIVLQPPTVTASPSPHVVKFPVTLTTTAYHTVVRSARAIQSPASTSPRDRVIAKPICAPCDDNPECDGCDFACDGGCEHFLCKDPLGEAELCISVAEDAETSKAYDTSMASSNFLGSAAMLLVFAGDEDPASTTAASHLQPAISNGTRPDFSFAQEDCYLCNDGDKSCDMCDWQFTCGIKKRCFHNGAREVFEMCFEKGEKCHP